MSINLQQEKQIILDAMDRTKNKVWASPPEIANFSGINLEHVLRIVYNSRDFMICPKRGRDGLPLFTSRRIYKARAPFWVKFLDFLAGDYV
ncbi:hypothetical protein [Chitinophaga sp.]|uniref:hypothetical protein n=1 Tax=Chitinophaga sp. TaxID=1869181 RepID=UPI0031DED098